MDRWYWIADSLGLPLEAVAALVSGGLVDEDPQFWTSEFVTLLSRPIEEIETLLILKELKK